MNVPKRASEQALTRGETSTVHLGKLTLTPLLHPPSLARHRRTPRMRLCDRSRVWRSVEAIEPARWDKISRIFAKPSCGGDDGVEAGYTLATTSIYPNSCDRLRSFASLQGIRGSVAAVSVVLRYFHLER
jgi:hypothetical protein